MSVNSSGVPLFAGIESVEDMFIATMEEMDKEVIDEVTLAHPFYQYLEKKNLIEYRSEIGTHVPVHLMDKPNSTVKDFSHYDDLDLIPQDALSEAKFAYGHVAGVQMYSREELVKNQGKQQLIDLVSAKQDQLKASMTNHFAELLMGSQDADGRKMMGLGRIMTYDAACGGIDPTVAGFGYWNPQRMLTRAGGSYSLATELRDGLRRLSRLCSYQGEKPDIQLAGEDVYDSMQAYAEGKLQVSFKDIQDSSGWGDFEMFDMPGRTVIYDDSLAAKETHLINTKRVKLRIHKGTNFQLGSWEKIKGKEAKSRSMLLYASLYCKRRNVNGYGLFT